MILVVFLFLGSVRATLIPLLAVPVALIGTFAVMLALGFSLNTVSLLALVLAIGIVVDDAIVVVENVERVMEENPGLSPADAARRAMGEITGAILAITMVLLSVFVPVAFIPGISGQLFQQFAVAVSVSMVISAINALTLSPALCAILLKPHHGPKRGPLGWVSRRIDGARDGYVRVAGAIARRAVFGLLLLAVAIGAAGWLFRIVPSGFLPSEDQGAFFVEVRLPEGASVNRTDAAMREVEAMLGGIDGVAGVVSVTGFSFLDGLAKSNSGLAFVNMLPFEERGDPGRSVLAAIGTAIGQGAAIREAQVFAFNLPPIIGLGTGSGFEYQLLDLEGRDPVELASVAGGLTVAASQDPRLGPTFTTFSAGTPQLFLDIDRERLQTLGVSVSDLFTALQGTLGSIYVNDFNLFGRTWQVNLQAAEADRDSVGRHRPPADPQRRRRDGAGQRGGAGGVRRRAAVDRALQQLPLGDAERHAGARGRLRHCAGGDGGDQRRDPAARLRLRLDRHGAAGEGGGRPDDDHPRAGAPLRLSVPGRPLRELDHPGAGAALGGGRGRRRARGALSGRPSLRHLRPDRARRADRARGEERHPDRRVRQGPPGGAACRSSTPRSRAPGPGSGPS